METRICIRVESVDATGKRTDERLHLSGDVDDETYMEALKIAAGGLLHRVHETHSTPDTTS